jgi:hypothetical protein
LYAFGLNEFGELGVPFNSGANTPNPTPALVGLPGGVSIETIARGATASHTLVVLADLSVATGSLAGGTVGRPYTAQLQSDGGVGPDKWSASGLPGGLSLNPSTGTISGTPTTPGAFSVTVSVTDADRIAASRTLALAIAPPLLSGLVVSPRRVSLAGRTVHGRCQPLTRSNRSARPCRLKLKLHLSFSVSAPATITVTFARISPGRRVNGRCTKPTHCTRVTTLPGTMSRAVKPGANRITFIRSHLAPGTYRLTITPKANARPGTPHTATVTITR